LDGDVLETFEVEEFILWVVFDLGFVGVDDGLVVCFGDGAETGVGTGISGG